jgi:hypothetical protein
MVERGHASSSAPPPPPLHASTAFLVQFPTFHPPGPPLIAEAGLDIVDGGGGLLLLDAAAAACVSRPHGRDHSAPLFGTTGDRGVAAAVPW